jgi:hypothetical protein
MEHSNNCPHCRAFLPPRPSRLLRGSVLGLAYIVTFAFVFVYACMGPLGLMVLPFLLPGAIGGITCAHSYASTGEACPECGKLLERKPVSSAAHPIGAVAQA